ncbi:Asp23/Gls24 family envelope stress response protein [Marinithermus hydrothermalis]|uniref:Asp23/Gls24 family envelope stress response protein n=1 Tax=Marinithermus hydrothermalis (strain DSM 14884 / JCM 11576 / T1) TaxID=869210 RepID=F2NNY0_MARHT|nr:Asp23/Gls24 family envelope stress response protein [Marinithermus hydrothermalis]AEB11568.1 protein of unknown function DUF322 [Marinithermus hydrothermalis DSM 14884]
MVDYELSENALVSLVHLSLEGLEGVQLAAPGARSVGDVLSGRRAKAVRIERGEEGLTVELSLVVAYGKPIPEAARQVQRVVTDTLSATTGLKVNAVNVTVVDVLLKEEHAAEG